MMKNNVLKYMVVAALIINAAALIFFWLKRPHGDGPPPSRPDQVLIETLNLDKNQQELYKTMRLQHHSAHDSLLKIIAAQRQVLYSQKQGANDTVFQKIGLMQQEIEQVTYDHFMAVRKICTPEQQVELDKLLANTVQSILTPKKRRGKPENEH
jgi:periplasmic protein CpxP/Spy